MKRIIVFPLTLIVIAIVFVISCNKNDKAEDMRVPGRSGTPQGYIADDIGQLSTFGWEKGQRKGCPSGSDKRCCGRKICIVTPISKIADGYDMNAVVVTPDYLECVIENAGNNQLLVTIPYNKILPETYDDWFINDVFEAEYFPLSNDVSDKFGLSDIAISAGNYNVTQSNDGYEILVNYEQHRSIMVQIAKGDPGVCPEGNGFCSIILWDASQYMMDLANGTDENTFTGIISTEGENKLLISIPFEGISESTYDQWFANDVFNIADIPMVNYLSPAVPGVNITILTGAYPVRHNGETYEILVDYEVD